MLTLVLIVGFAAYLLLKLPQIGSAAPLLLWTLLGNPQSTRGRLLAGSVIALLLFGVFLWLRTGVRG